MLEEFVVLSNNTIKIIVLLRALIVFFTNKKNMFLGKIDICFFMDYNT